MGFTVLCNCHHHLTLEQLHLLLHENLHTQLAVSSFSIPSDPPTNTSLLSTDLPVWGISYIWNHATCSLLCLASLSMFSSFSRIEAGIHSIASFPFIAE